MNKNILNIKNSIDSHPLSELSEFLLMKNGIQFQNFIHLEENSELIVEILKNQNDNDLASELADFFITSKHIDTSFRISEAVEGYAFANQRMKVSPKDLCISLSQLNKEVLKNLNRDNNNLDVISFHLGISKLGAYQLVNKKNNLDLVNSEITKKIERTKQRNGYTEDYKQLFKKKDWDEIFLLMAFAMASGAHCVSRQVGALLVKNKRIISTGINGTPEGCQNCDDIFPEKTDPKFNRAEHHKFSSKNEIHAEMNAVLYKARKGGGYNLDGSTLYCTTQPCDDCLKNMLQSGITRIVYAESYDLSDYSEFIIKAIKEKQIELVHKPLSNTARAFVFTQNSMVKTGR